MGLASAVSGMVEAIGALLGLALDAQGVSFDGILDTSSQVLGVLEYLDDVFEDFLTSQTVSAPLLLA